MKEKEIVLSYPRLIPQQRDFLPPDMAPSQALFQQTGFSTPTETVAIRGSTAALLPTDGRLTFRHPKSDVDIIAITESGRPGYFIRHKTVEGIKREIDILYFPLSALSREEQQRRSFLTTKLSQPGWPLANLELYDQLRTKAVISLICAAIARESIHQLTPSGGAKLVIEQDLYAEPWRWTSFLTYYLQPPYDQRQISQLYANAKQALSQIGQPCNNQTDHETKYQVDIPYTPLFHHRALDRLVTSFRFVCDQLSILSSSRQGFSLDNAVRLLMKWRSLATNPTLSYNADIIFRRN